MNKMKNVIKLVIIKENGDIDYIANGKNGSEIISIPSETHSMAVFKKINEMNLSLEDEKVFSRHLFYLKEYLKNNFVENFKDINCNPQRCDSDLLLYYYMTVFNNIILINGTIHNILVIPKQGINEQQLDKLFEMTDVFKGNESWNLADNIHIEIEEKDGQKFGFLETGNTIKGSINEVINAYSDKLNQKEKNN